MTKPITQPKIPAPPRAAREAMTRMEQYYFSVLIHWYRYRKEPPSCEKLAALCRPVKSHTAVRTALLSLEAKGYVARNATGRFEVVK